MSKKKLIFLSLALLLCLIIIIVSSNWRIKSYYYRYLYDLNHTQQAVTSTDEIDAVFKDFQKIKFQDLSESYKEFTKSKDPKYKVLLSQKTYFVIGRNDFYKYIVGKFRIEDFLAKDKYFRKSVSSKSENYYWLMDKQLLYKVLELQNELEKEGYNKWKFSITNGHRHPRYNEQVGGAKLSRHIKGEAIDIRIYDIDNNGRYEKKDKDIVLQILENKVIKDQGGIGRYPGTRAVHFDVRGFRARWDSY